MSLMRMPLFTWMTLVTAILLVLAFPVITVALIELLFDRAFGMNFFNVAAGANPVLWQHLFWVFGHPEVYILILPAMGIVSEILPVFSKKPLFGYATVVLAGVVIAFMGRMVWSHHMFTVGLGPVANSVFTITTMLIAVPTGIKVFNWMGTMWGGSIDLKTPMLFAIAFVSMFVIGGISGVMHSIAASDAQQQDTYFIVAHIHYVLFGGAIFAILAGVYYWFPKLTGRMYDEKMGQIHFWLMFIGQNVTFFPMHFNGLDGAPIAVDDIRLVQPLSVADDLSPLYLDDVPWNSDDALYQVSGCVLRIGECYDIAVVGLVGCDERSGFVRLTIER